MIGLMENNKEHNYDELKVILERVALFFHIWEFQVQISGRKLAVLAEGFCGFPLCVQANEASIKVSAVHSGPESYKLAKILFLQVQAINL
jgi:hypothetical protein